MKFADRGVVDKTLVRIIRGNVREPDQLVGDVYALATGRHLVLHVKQEALAFVPEMLHVTGLGVLSHHPSVNIVFAPMSILGLSIHPAGRHPSK